MQNNYSTCIKAPLLDEILQLNYFLFYVCVYIYLTLHKSFLTFSIFVEQKCQRLEKHILHQHVNVKVNMGIRQGRYYDAQEKSQV